MDELHIPEVGYSLVSQFSKESYVPVRSESINLPKKHSRLQHCDFPELFEKQFAPYFSRHIYPYIGNLEQQRQQAAVISGRRFKVSSALALFLLIFAFATFIYCGDIGVDIGDVVQGYSIVIPALFSWCYWPMYHYRKNLQESIYPKVIAFFGDEFTYQPEVAPSIESYYLSNLIPPCNVKSTEDYVKGNYKKVAIESFGLHLTRHVTNGKHTIEETVFRGLIIALSLAKNFTGKTVITNNFKLGLPHRLEHIKLEDPLFNQYYCVYGTDQIEARCLVTPSFMQRLLQLRSLFSNANIKCIFYDKQLSFAIETGKSRFESDSRFESEKFITDVTNILREMHLIFQIVDVLKLDEKTII